MGQASRLALIVVCASGVTAALILLTPLRWMSPLTPSIQDVLPTLFHQDFEKSPKKYVFIDVRSSGDYEEAHAQGSINIPLHLLFDEWRNLPKQDKTIVLICDGGRASGVAYSYLEHHGFLNLERISGGFQAWKEANLPIAAAGSE